MIKIIEKQKFSLPFRALVSLIILTFCSSLIIVPNAQAQTVLNLPIPGMMVQPTMGFQPALVKGIKLFPNNPLRFNFIIDLGESELEGDAVEQESSKLIKYFLAALTTPEEDLWVNLSPYEADRIIPESFGYTEMGRDLLAQDYLLKQLTASLMYPEHELGETFWDQIFEKAYEQYGTTDIPINTFNKVWIMPQSATVYENEDTAYVIESHLKVMLEEDYLARDKNSNNEKFGTDSIDNDDVKQLSALSSMVVRDIILPAIEKEINEGKTFAQLRQIYHALILATWFKMNLKESLLGKIYVDQNKVSGVDVEDKHIKDKIYQQYLEAFKKGVYDYVRDDFEPVTQQIIPRKYFSGGAVGKFGVGDLKVVQNVSDDVIDRMESANSPVIEVEVSGELLKASVKSAGSPMIDEIKTTEYRFEVPPRTDFNFLRNKYVEVFDEIKKSFQAIEYLLEDSPFSIKPDIRQKLLYVQDIVGNTISISEAINNSLDAIADEAERLGKNYLGEIKLSFKIQNKKLIVELEDNGIGMSYGVIRYPVKYFSTRNRWEARVRRIGGEGQGTMFYGEEMLSQSDGSLYFDTKGQTGAYNNFRRFGDSPKDWSTEPSIGDRQQNGTLVQWTLPFVPILRVASPMSLVEKKDIRDFLEEDVATAERILGLVKTKSDESFDLVVQNSRIFIPALRVYAKEKRLSLDEYYEFLREESNEESSQEIERIVNEFNNSLHSDFEFTGLFRDSTRFVDLIDGFISRKWQEGDLTIRQRFIGTASGEEVYSMMILYHQKLKVLYNELKIKEEVSEDFEFWLNKWEFKIDAFDLSLPSLLKAKEGVFNKDKVISGLNSVLYALENVTTESLIKEYFEEASSEELRFRNTFQSLFNINYFFTNLNQRNFIEILTSSKYDMTFSLNTILRHVTSWMDITDILGGLLESQKSTYMFVFDAFSFSSYKGNVNFSQFTEDWFSEEPNLLISESKKLTIALAIGAMGAEVIQPFIKNNPIDRLLERFTTDYRVSTELFTVADWAVGRLKNRSASPLEIDKFVKGGIDFNPDNLNLKTQGKGMNFDVPFFGLLCIDDDGVCEQVNMLELENMNIQGLMPVILQITPIVNLPLVLGLRDNSFPCSDDEECQSRVTSAIKPEEIIL